MQLSFGPVQCFLLILLGSLAVVSGSSNSLAIQHSRAKRQNDGATKMLINAVKAFILGGGVDKIKGNSDKMGALKQFVTNQAVRSVLGEGVVGKVLGAGLGGNKQSSSGAGGMLSKAMGLFGAVTGGGSKTPAASGSSGSLASLAAKFLGH